MRQEIYQSSQDIDFPEEQHLGILMETENHDVPSMLSRPTREKGIIEFRPQVKWPGTSYKKGWKTINEDIITILEGLTGHL